MPIIEKIDRAKKEYAEKLEACRIYILRGRKNICHDKRKELLFRMVWNEESYAEQKAGGTGYRKC